MHSVIIKLTDDQFKELLPLLSKLKGEDATMLRNRKIFDFKNVLPLRVIGKLNENGLKDEDAIRRFILIDESTVTERLLRIKGFGRKAVLRFYSAFKYLFDEIKQSN